VTEEELSTIQKILEPLNKNPLASEELNPMASALKRKIAPLMGDEETPSEEGETPASDLGAQELGEDSSDDLDLGDDLEEPSFKTFDDDDIDLDELLRDPSDAPPEKEEESEPALEAEDPLSDLGEVDEPATEEDPFAGLGDVPEATTTEEDPFSGLGDLPEPSMDLPEATSEEDPFAGLGESLDTPSPSQEEEPFSGLGDLEEPAPEPKAQDEILTNPFLELDQDNPFAGGNPFEESARLESPVDPFAGVGSTQEAPLEPPVAEEDPFAGLGEIEEDKPKQQQEEDPLGDLGAPSPSSEEDPFAGLGDTPTPSAMDDDPFGDLGAPAASSDDDPFAGLGDIATPSASSDDPFGGLDSEPSGGGGLDDLGSSEDDSGLGDLGDSFAGSEEPQAVEDSGPSIEDDLESLGQEEEPEENYEESLTDEDLALIQRELLAYPAKLRRVIIDSIANDKINKRNQKELLELIKNETPAEGIVEFLSPLLGMEIDIKETSYSEDGVPIIATDPAFTKEGALKRKKYIRNIAIAATTGFFLIFGSIFLYKNVIRPAQASQEYEQGLNQIQEYILAGKEGNSRDKQEYLKQAEIFFKKGEEIDPDNLHYLNRYATSYYRAGLYEKSFEKLFGRVEPPYSWKDREDVPVLALDEKVSWEEFRDNPLKKLMVYSKDKKRRNLVFPGAFIVSRLKYKKHDIETYTNLGKFHSSDAKDFIEETPFKNDKLAISYYKKILTDAGEPNNIQAHSGIAKIYYNQRELASAAHWYNRIIELYPTDPIGHGGLLNSFIEMWKKDGNPTFVLNHHRRVRNALGIEGTLPIFTLTKLSYFYTQLKPDDINIIYNINPRDNVTMLDIDDNALHLLNLIFNKTEIMPGESIGLGENLWNEMGMFFGRKDRLGERRIKGSEYADAYFYRGKYYQRKKETQLAMNQFELAATKDKSHYPAVLEMADYFMNAANYNEATMLLKEAENRYLDYRNSYGRREEDETLMEGDPGRIYFQRGKILYLEASGVASRGVLKTFEARKIYPMRARGISQEEEEEKRRELVGCIRFFETAESMNLKDPKMKYDMSYYKGWVEYTNNNFSSALDEWSELGEELAYTNINLLMAKGNSFFYTNQLNASLGNYMKVKSSLEDQTVKMGTPNPDSSVHQELFNSLVAVYNNMGAVYEKKGDSLQALKYYWKAIETARQFNEVSEIANTNKDMVFRNGLIGREPLLEDWLSPDLKRISELR
jgi:tetratricopeptide (TPR) repeat protein